MKKRELTFLITVLILGAVIGGLVGDVVATFLPTGAAKTVLTKTVEIGFGPTQIDLYTISFVAGMKIKLNLMSALFVLLVIVYFRWWYL